MLLANSFLASFKISPPQVSGLLCLLPCLPCLAAPLLAPESPRLLLLRGADAIPHIGVSLMKGRLLEKIQLSLFSPFQWFLGERTLALDSLQWLRGEFADLGQVSQYLPPLPN